jgi:hypothetical protein
VYTVKIGETVYVLHAFQKKSHHGIATSKTDLDLIAQRLRKARRDRQRPHPDRAELGEIPAQVDQDQLARATLSRRFKTDAGMLPQFRPLEVSIADKQKGTHETDRDRTPPDNISEGSEPTGSVTRPVRANERNTWSSSSVETRNP